MDVKITDIEKNTVGMSNAEKEEWIETANDVLHRCMDSEGGSAVMCTSAAIQIANKEPGLSVN